MKRALALSCSFLFTLAGCGREPVVPAPGGQSGDDGDVSPDKGEPPVPAPPGIPSEPCDGEELQIELSAETPFGASPRELVERLGANGDSPLFWVAYDQIADVTFSPAPGETSLALALAARDRATLTTWQPTQQNANCPAPSLRVPIRVSVRTSDGALDESAESELVFSSASLAYLSNAEFPASSLRGSFAFEDLGDPAEGYAPGSLLLEASFWPGGSRGSIAPLFAETGPVHPPQVLANPVNIAPGSPIAMPSVPDHWSSVAVWPRRERCAGDGRGRVYAFAPDDALIGSSMRDVVNALDARGPWLLALGNDTARLRFDADAPEGLRCAALNDGTLSFEVSATLRSDADPLPALAAFSATSVYEITAKAGLDGTLAELRWERRDLYDDESRSAFESATGLELDAADDYQQIWWSWHGLEQREGDAWAARGGLVVSSLNREQAAEVARIQAQGGPGVGFTFDESTQFPVMPGDALIDAAIVP